MWYTCLPAGIPAQRSRGRKKKVRKMENEHILFDIFVMARVPREGLLPWRSRRNLKFGRSRGRGNWNGNRGCLW